MFLHKIKSLYYHLQYSTISLISHVVPAVITIPLVFLTLGLEIFFLIKFATALTWAPSVVVAFFTMHTWFRMYGDSVQRVNASEILKRLNFDDFYGMTYVEAETVYDSAYVNSDEIRNLWKSERMFFKDSFAFVFVHSPFGVRVYAHKDFIKTIKLTDRIIEAISGEANRKLAEFRMKNPTSKVSTQSSWME